MWVTTMWARSSEPIPSWASPSITFASELEGPVSIRAGSSACSRYADVSWARVAIMVSMATIPVATSTVSATAPKCSARKACQTPRLSSRSKGGTMVAVNVVVLAGRLSDVPEVKVMPSGDQVTRFRLYVPEAGKRILPLPVSAWDRLARKGCEHLTKGDAVLVRGHLVRRFFRDGGGGRSVTEVVATEVKRLESEGEE